MLTKILQSIDALIIKTFSKSGFLSSIYYTFFCTKFYREHKAVLLGRMSYKESLKIHSASSTLLRRNIHRLEKGLIMRPMRNVFAEEYIVETVKCYARNHDSKELDIEEFSWATDVLSKYFKVVGNSPLIDQARNIFFALNKKESLTNYFPYPHKDLPVCSVSYSQLFQLFKRRRSVRWYLKKEVAIETIREAVKAAALAPTACNRQPYRFYITNNPLKAEGIASCAMGTTGFASNLPSVIVVVGNLGAYQAERDRHVIYIDGALAAMQLMLALETLGLSSCPINWPDIEEREKLLSQKLNLGYHERVIMLIAVGYADPEGEVAFSQKKPDTLLIHEI